MATFSVQKDSPIPYYYQIEEWLRSQIEQGILKPGDLLPTEKALGEQLGVSRITIRQALKNLTDAGLVERRRAKGTFVAYPRTVVPFVRNQLRGLTEELSRDGLLVRSKVLTQEVVPAAGEAMHAMQVPANTPLFLIRRLRSVQNIPIVIETSYHPHARFPELLEMDLNNRSIYEILESKYQARPVQATDSFFAEIASKEVAQLLEIETGAPIMNFKRIARDRQGEIMEFTFSIYRADYYQFVIEYHEEL